MRKLAILTFVSLDGVMQGVSSPDEDPSGGFTQGGWAAPYWDGVMDQVRSEAMSEPYDMLFGRKTYEMFAAYWPNLSSEDPEARRMNEAAKYVISSTLQRLAWQNTVLVSGDVVEEVARLKERDGPLLQVHGSWALIQALLAADLIDEFRLWTFPVVLGAGKRLFGDGLMPRTLRLKKSAPSGNGVVMTVYRRDQASAAAGPVSVTS